MRAGTSKGLFIHRSHLPPSLDDWATPLLAAMGSKNNDARRIDGVGGGTSVTSKVAVVAPSDRPGVDVEYTFVQVAVGSETVDLSGNCGNICSGVGPFAVQERLVTPLPGARSVDVRIFNTNTSKVIVETVYVDENGNVEEDGDCLIPGVKGPGSEIKVAFIEPVGSMTGKLFPSGRRAEFFRNLFGRGNIDRLREPVCFGRLSDSTSATRHRAARLTPVFGGCGGNQEARSRSHGSC